MMELDEAIKHCLEVAERQEISANDKEMYSEMLGEDYKGFEDGCQECASEHRQLAEWLTELKEAKRLLKLAVEDYPDLTDMWRYADKVMKLIGGDESDT